LQKLNDFVKEIVKNCLSIKILGKTELKWPPEDDSFSFELNKSGGNLNNQNGHNDMSSIMPSNSLLLQTSGLPDLDLSV